MKKLVIVLVLLFAATALFAQINLGDFPVGKWLDANYSATWSFTSNNITIDSPEYGSWTFAGKTIQDFRVFMSGMSPSLSFSCPEAGRSYVFKVNPTNASIDLEITRSGLPVYAVNMRKQ